MENKKITDIKNLTDEQKAEILSKFYDKEKNSLSENGQRIAKKSENDKSYFYITISRLSAERESKYSVQFNISESYPSVWVPFKDIFGLDNKVSLIVRIRLHANNVYYVNKDKSIIGEELRKYAD